MFATPSQASLYFARDAREAGDKDLEKSHMSDLRDITGQDFGDDLDLWKAWVENYPLFVWNHRSGVPIEAQIEEHVAEMKARQK